MQSIANQDVLDAARGWIDVPYRHQGRTRERGVDCIGFILAVWNDIGLPEIDVPSNYSSHPTTQYLMKHTPDYLIETDKTLDDVEVGDVLVLWGYQRNVAQHYAIVGEHAGRLTMIHAWSKHKKVVEHPITDFWIKRIVKIFEFPED